MVPSIAKVNGDHGTLLVDTHLRHNGATSGSYMNGHTTGEVPIHEEPFGSKKKMRIAMLGAGISGLNFFKFAEQKLENVEIVCYEKNGDVGGTWLENRYPGCACDIPSVVYQFPWRPVRALSALLGYGEEVLIACQAPWSKYCMSVL
jgi:cation diffusion facilitator CzcD-associated flavoprotein CzcO